MTQHDFQDTFLSVGELFSQSARWCFAAERSVRDHSHEVDTPYTEAMALIADTEHGLAKELEKCAESAPQELVNTRVQYTTHRKPPPTANTLSEALTTMMQVNLQLSQTLQGLIQKSAPGPVRETIDTLYQNIDHINKKISMIHLTVRDI